MFAFVAFLNGRGDAVGGEEVVGVGNGRFCLPPQPCVKNHRHPPPRPPVKNLTLRHRLPGHFFQTERLGAKLNFVIVPFAFLPVLVFNGDKRIMK